MTFDEFKALVGDMETLWPLAPTWPADTIRHAFTLGHRLEVDDLEQAVQLWFDAGHHWPPNPAELLKLAREQGQRHRENLPALEISEGEPIKLSDYLRRRKAESLRELATREDAQ